MAQPQAAPAGTAQPWGYVASAASYGWSFVVAHPYVAVTALGLGLVIGGVTYFSRGTILKAPKSGQWGLGKLPKDRLWMLIINPKDFDKATKAECAPEDYYGFYDEADKLRPVEKRTTDFKVSMLAAIGAELNFGDDGGRLGTVVDFPAYVALHDLVTSSFKEGEKVGTVASIRAHSSVDTATAFPINDWDRKAGDIAADLKEETIGDRQLCYPWKMGDRIDEIPCLTFFSADDGRININYSVADGKLYAGKILARYYLEVAAAKTPEARLTAIVRAIRAIHVLHPFRDANGRLHGQILLNKLLLEQGFSPSILPYPGLGIFGGAFSIAQLVRAVGEGMETFLKVCKSKRD